MLECGRSIVVGQTIGFLAALLFALPARAVASAQAERPKLATWRMQPAKDLGRARVRGILS